jgi:hypothetical protein
LNKNAHKQAQIGASADRDVKKKENDLVEQKYKELKAKYPSMSDAEAQARAKQKEGVK